MSAEILLALLVIAAAVLLIVSLYSALVLGARMDEVDDAWFGHALLPRPALATTEAGAVRPARPRAPPTIRIEPVTAPMVSDAELHHWGEIYRANPALAARGVRFETFVRAPEVLLRAVVYDVPEVEPAERHVDPDDLVWHRRPAGSEQDRALRGVDADTLAVRDGALVEPLKHRRLRPHPETRAHRPWRLTEAR